MLQMDTLYYLSVSPVMHIYYYDIHEPTTLLYNIHFIINVILYAKCIVHIIIIILS